MPTFDVGVLKVPHEGQEILVVVDLSLEVLGGLPLFEALGQLHVLLGVLIDDVFPVADYVGIHSHPGKLLPLLSALVDPVVEVVQLVEVLDVVLDLEQLLVLLVMQSEEVFSLPVGLVEGSFDLKVACGVRQPVGGLLGGDSLDLGARLLEVDLELLDVLYKLANGLLEVSKELALAGLEVSLDDVGVDQQLLPLAAEVVLVIDFVAVGKLILEMLLEKSVHVEDGVELHVNLGLLLSNILQSLHHVA